MTQALTKAPAIVVMRVVSCGIVREGYHPRARQGTPPLNGGTEPLELRKGDPGLPLYEYECPEHGRFELVQKFSDPPLTKCPQCGKPVQKLLSEIGRASCRER